MRIWGIILALCFGAGVWAEETNLLELLRQKCAELDAAQGLAPAPAVSVTNVPVAPAVQPVAAPEPQTGALMVGDVIEVVVEGESDMDLPQTKLGDGGTIRHATWGSVQAVGKTTAEVAAAVRAVLAKDYLVNPQVAVKIVHRAQCSFTIANQVARPGTYNWPANETMTVLRAIAVAGGLTRSTAGLRISVQRVENGQAKLYRVDLNELQRNPRQAPLVLRDGDLVEVGTK